MFVVFKSSYSFMGCMEIGVMSSNKNRLIESGFCLNIKIVPPVVGRK